jgi:hypothetical protein
LKKIFSPLIALLAGSGLAVLAAGVSSYFFVLLPILAFILGYFSSWCWGHLYGFLLFASYTFTISLIWLGIDNINLFYPIPYIAVFIVGGFTLPLIGALASQLRKGLKRASSITALAILVIIVGWCGYTAIPHYSYYYQISVVSDEKINNLELLLPMGTVSGEPYEKLYAQSHRMPGDLTEKFTRDIVDTEHGIMLKITVPTLEPVNDKVPEPRYIANIIFREGEAFWQKIVPFELIQLMPKSDVILVDTVTAQQFSGPVKRRESKAIEQFNVPVKATADSPVQINLSLWNRTDRGEALNFTYIYSKSESYTERIDYDMQTDGEWRYVPVEAATVMEIRGMSD